MVIPQDGLLGSGVSAFTQYNPVVVVELGGPAAVEVCDSCGVCEWDDCCALAGKLCPVEVLFCEHEGWWLLLPLLLFDGGT